MHNCSLDCSQGCLYRYTTSYSNMPHASPVINFCPKAQHMLHTLVVCLHIYLVLIIMVYLAVATSSISYRNPIVFVAWQHSNTIIGTAVVEQSQRSTSPTLLKALASGPNNIHHPTLGHKGQRLMAIAQIIVMLMCAMLAARSLTSSSQPAPSWRAPT